MKRLFAFGLSLGLVAALAVPALAEGAHNKATGSVDWAAQGGAVQGLMTSFDVHDGAPGKTSSYGDRGTVEHYNPTVGSYVLDVVCAKVNADWAAFAGLVTEATGGYAVGDARIWYVEDGGTPGSDGDVIGSNVVAAGIGAACNTVLYGSQSAFPQAGVITAGNIVVHFDAE